MKPFSVTTNQEIEGHCLGMEEKLYLVESREVRGMKVEL